MKKTFCSIGIIVSAAIILIGILTVSGALGGNTNSASTASYLYDSGYASFGADFYTYVTNNAEEAASASRTVAGNLTEIAKLLKNVIGFGLICFGVLSGCAFGIAATCGSKPKQKTENTQPEKENIQPTTENAQPEKDIASPTKEIVQSEEENAPAEEQPALNDEKADSTEGE